MDLCRLILYTYEKYRSKDYIHKVFEKPWREFSLALKVPKGL